MAEQAAEAAELIEVADRLYALPAAAFVAAREEEARACEDTALGTRVRKLRKPSVAAAAVNLLVRREAGRIDEALDLAGALREAAASMDGEELRTLTRQRRRLTHALASSARTLARAEGVRLTAATTAQVEQMLNAAMLDPVAADVLRTGLVLTAFTATGVGTVDVDAVLAVPAAVGLRAAPVEVPVTPLRVVPDTDEIRQARREEAVAAAEEALASAVREHDDAAQVAADADAERLRLADELDAARRRVADLEDELDRVDAAAAEAVDAREAAADAVAEARTALERARAAARG